MECQNCGHEWNYTGQKDPGMYVNCPMCYYKVQIPDPAND